MTYHSHHLSCVRGQGSGYEETDSLRRDTSTKEQGEASVREYPAFSGMGLAN
jgi:hypothetical protein